jgi:hypothetical protein
MSSEVSGEEIDALLIVADLRGPEILDLRGVLGGLHHPPAIDAQLPVGERHRRQFHAHTLERDDERLDVEFRHFHFPPPNTLRLPRSRNRPRSTQPHRIIET